MVYQDYANGVKASTNFVDVLTDNMLNNYNKKINASIDKQLNDVYSNQHSSYETTINRKIAETQNEIENIKNYLKNDDLPLDKRNELNEDLRNQEQNLKWFQNSSENFKSDVDAKQVRFSFENANEFKLFCANATQQNIFGCGCADKLNGQYVFVTNETQATACQQIAKDYHLESFNIYKGYDVKNINMDSAYTGTSQGVVSAYKVSQMQSDAGRSQAQIEEVSSMISGVFTKKVEAPNRAVIQDQFATQFNDVLHGYQSDYNRYQDTKLQNGKDILDYQRDFSTLDVSRQNYYESQAERLGYVDTNGNVDGSRAWYTEEKSKWGLMKGSRENFNYEVKDLEAFQTYCENIVGTDKSGNVKDMSFFDIAKERETILNKIADNPALSNIIDIDGNIDVEALERAVALGNISQEEMDFVMLTGVENPSNKMNFGVSSMFRRMAREMEMPIQDFIHLVDRTKQSIKLVKSARRITVNLKLKHLDRKIKKKNDLINVAKDGKDDLIQAKDKLVKKQEKLEKKLNPNKTQSKFRIKKNKIKEEVKGITRAIRPSTQIKKALEKRAKKGGKISNRILKVTNKFSSLGKKIGELLKKKNAFILKIKGTIFKYCGIVLVIYLILALFVMLITAILSTVSGFEGGAESDTIGMRVYKDLKKEETDWLEACADTDNLWRKKNKIKWGDNYIDLGQYVNSNVNGATSDGTNIQINAFNFQPKDSSALKTADSFDGGSEFLVNSSAGSNHTSNIKDILSMADVMFGNDMEGNSIFGQTIKEAGDQTIKEWKTSDSALKRWWGTYVEMETANQREEMKACGVNVTDDFEGSTTTDDSEDNPYNEKDVANIEEYCKTLFSASHQESFGMSVVVYPINTETSTTNAEATDTGDAGVNSEVLTECPKGGCASSSAFKWVIADKDGDGTKELYLGLEDTNGYYHDMTSSVLYDEFMTKKKVDKKDACIDEKENYTADWWTYTSLKNNNCWDETQDAPIVVESNDDNAQEIDVYGYDKNAHQMVHWTSDKTDNPAYVQWKNNRDANFDNEKYKIMLYYCYNNGITKAKGGTNPQQMILKKCLDDTSKTTTNAYDWCYIDGYKDTAFCSNLYNKLYQSDKDYIESCANNVFGSAPNKYIFTNHISRVTWNCKGHSCHYCGGHLKIHTTGQVYGMTEEQLHYMNGEEKVDKDVDEIFKPCYDEKKLDLSSPKKASETGLNILIDENGKWSTSKVADVTIEQNTYVKGLKSAEDIFDIDYMLKYGDIFNTDYKQYGGWNFDNQQLACLKASMDWGDLYGFSPELTLGCGSLSSEDIKLIIDNVKDYQKRVNNYTLLPDEEKAIELALSCVGAGQYSQAHHGHGYMGRCACTGSEHCNITDCSGFTSYINTRFPESNQSKVFGCNADNPAVGITSTSGYIGSSMPKALWTTYGHWGKVRPASTIVSNNNGEGHAMFVIGYVDKEFTLSDGTVIQANKPITVDCTTVEEPGNIYLNSFNYGQPQVKKPEQKKVYVFPLE